MVGFLNKLRFQNDIEIEVLAREDLSFHYKGSVDSKPNRLVSFKSGNCRLNIKIMSWPKKIQNLLIENCVIMASNNYSHKLFILKFITSIMLRARLKAYITTSARSSEQFRFLKLNDNFTRIKNN